MLAFHVNWMRERGYAKAINYLPHDGVNENNITGKKYEDHWREAGFTVEPPVKNQGKGAAMMRIEALRRLGPQLWWNEATTEPGRDAIGFYHERKDDARNVGLGPEHAHKDMRLLQVGGDVHFLHRALIHVGIFLNGFDQVRNAGSAVLEFVGDPVHLQQRAKSR